MILAVTSCKPLSKIGNKNVKTEYITKDNFKRLDGTYANSFDSTIGQIVHSPYNGINNDEQITILSQLFLNYPETAWRDKNGVFIDSKEKWIKLDFQSKNLAIVSMYHNNNFLFSKKIRGKFKNGYFYVRPKNFVVPLIPLVFGYNFERARMGISVDHLIIDYRVNRWGVALVAGSADKGYVSSLFKKKSL
jgi:hypothetical protein